MSVPELNVDLDLPPAERWVGLAQFADAARSLMVFYNQDIGGQEMFGKLLTSYRDAVVEQEYLDEMQAIAKLLCVSEFEVLLANFYYDALKVTLGCTAFAVESNDGPLHARNLDWWSDNQLLAQHSLVINYKRGAELCYQVVGWPGYIGALSGMKPGVFAVTLNAVLSSDAPALNPPVTLLLRSVLANALNYDDAVETLRASPIASDCLLLVTGSKSGQMSVIERTPTRAAVRFAERGVLVVANDYRVLPQSAVVQSTSQLAVTSCSRYDRAQFLSTSSPPTSLDECFSVLTDPGVRMQMTMQSMVFQPSTGHYTVRIPPTVTSSSLPSVAPKHNP
jgi:acid ceramidase